MREGEKGEREEEQRREKELRKNDIPAWQYGELRLLWCDPLPFKVGKRSHRQTWAEADH